MPSLLCNNCCVRSGGRYYSSEGSIIIFVDRGFQITIICYDPTTTTEDMKESISCCGKIYRSFDEVTLYVGGGSKWEVETNPKGAQLSPSNELSDELSCGLMWRVQAEISE